jgi:DnaJ-class molecular chaperone
VLDVARDADHATIRKAYHRMALLHHPDKTKAPDAEERFREVQAAYEILSVPNERAWCASAKRKRHAALRAAVLWQRGQPPARRLTTFARCAQV